MTTMARQQQLETLKYKRRRERVRHFVNEQPQEPPFMQYMKFVAEVRRIAMCNIMPSQERFDLCKYTHFGTAAELCAKYGVTWQTVAEDAGLKWGRG